MLLYICSHKKIAAIFAFVLYLCAFISIDNVSVLYKTGNYKYMYISILAAANCATP